KVEVPPGTLRSPDTLRDGAVIDRGGAPHARTALDWNQVEVQRVTQPLDAEAVKVTQTSPPGTKLVPGSKPVPGAPKPPPGVQPMFVVSEDSVVAAPPGPLANKAGPDGAIRGKFPEVKQIVVESESSASDPLATRPA